MRAIWTAARQTGMHTVAGKTEEQQAILAHGREYQKGYVSQVPA
jgi:hypothetical protein